MLKPMANKSRILPCRKLKSISANSRPWLLSCSNSRMRWLAKSAESEIALLKLDSQSCTACSSSVPTPFTKLPFNRIESINGLSDSGMDATLRKVGFISRRSISERNFLSRSVCSKLPRSKTESDGRVTKDQLASDRKSVRWSSQASANAVDHESVSEPIVFTFWMSAISLFNLGKVSNADFKLTLCFESVSNCISILR